jgi:hypothetical protein
VPVPKIRKTRQPRTPKAGGSKKETPRCIYMKDGKYEVIVCGKYVGIFETVEQAVTARDDYKQSVFKKIKGSN